jgi:hypothetical protein
MSSRTLNYVKNWWSYENISVHLLFLSAFHGYDNIFVNCWPNNMILGAFWREFIVLSKTGLNQWGPVHIWTGLFAVFVFQIWKTGPPVWSFSGLGPVQSRSLASPRTGLPNTKHFSLNFFFCPRSHCKWPECQIATGVSQVTPPDESIEMVQYMQGTGIRIRRRQRKKK